MPENKGTEIVIHDLSEGDVTDIMSIIKYWVREDGKVVESEVKIDFDLIHGSLDDSSGSHYLVAKDETGKIFGTMGFGELNLKFVPYKSSPSACSVGLLTAFFSPDARGRGLGSLLLNSLFDKAMETGAAEMIWSSNPRFRKTAWNFYTSIAGEPIGMISDLFYPESVSPVWRKVFL